jgi:uncharacterized phage-associated protein
MAGLRTLSAYAIFGVEKYSSFVLIFRRHESKSVLRKITPATEHRCASKTITGGTVGHRQEGGGRALEIMSDTTSAAVANGFLALQEGDNSTFPPIDQMKIQKLVFYAHAWWLAMRDRALFEEEVYAWPWGPVVPNIYGAFKEFGRNPIVGKRATELVRTGSKLDFRIHEPEPPEGEVFDFLKAIWDGHKMLSGTQLSNATHAPGEPWTIVKDKYVDLSTKPVIPNDLIKEVFKAKIQK